MSDELVPRLPGDVADRPSIVARPSAPLPTPETGEQTPLPPPPPMAQPFEIPPVEAPPPDPRHRREDQPEDAGEFTPLRSDPPPRLFATWWLRYLLALTLLVAIGVTLATEYGLGPGGLVEQPVVIVPHALAALLLTVWSALAMADVERITPARMYQRRARASVAATLWVLAFAAPLGGWLLVDRVRERFDQPDDDGWVVAAATLVVLVCFLVIWLPFRYVAHHGRRAGAPTAILVGWFWLPLVAAVGAVGIVALGLDDSLADGGMSDLDRTIQLAVGYGVPMFVFTLATWRATTVVDEVVDLRWRRWRAEWNQTLERMSAQPPPPPER